MRRRILAAILGIATIAILAVSLPLSLRLGDQTRSDALQRLERAADGQAARIASESLPIDEVELPDLAYEGDLTAYGLNAVLATGEGPATADAFAERALDGRTSSGNANGELVIAVPIVRELKVVGAVRAAEKLSVSDAIRTRQRVLILLLSVGAWLLALIAGYVVSAPLVRPIQGVRDAAILLGHGDFSARVPPSAIREINEVANALDETAQRLDALIARERAFSAHASHQLRTPLTSLRLAVETELVAPRPDPHAALHEVLAETDRLEATISEMLLVARDASPRTVLNPNAVARAAQQRWVVRFAGVERSVRLHSESTAASINGSAPALGQILDVLCDNALCHGDGDVVIGVRNGLGGGTVITVADEGLGMASDPFTRTDAGFGGQHGFGLALAASLAANEGARLRLAGLGPQPVFELVFI